MSCLSKWAVQQLAGRVKSTSFSRLCGVCCFILISRYSIRSTVLTMWSQKTITNTTTHSVDKAAGKTREQTVLIVTLLYANVLAGIRIVLMLLWHLLMWNRSSNIQQNSALVFIVSEQALLPPDQKPLGSCGHINQLWPRSAPLIGREVGLQGEGFLHSRCACVCLPAVSLMPAWVWKCEWNHSMWKTWIIYSHGDLSNPWLNIVLFWLR